MTRHASSELRQAVERGRTISYLIQLVSSEATDRHDNITEERSEALINISTTLPKPAELGQMAIIDPEIQQLQQQIPQSWQVPKDKDPESLIKLMRASWANLPVPPPTTEVKESISSYTSQHRTTLRLRAFKPAKQTSKPLPLLIWYHGGGGCLGCPKSTAPVRRTLVLEQSCAVVAPQYRLAPENTSPAQVQDSWDALQHIAAHAADFGADAAASFVVGGESTGAVIVAVLALLARNEGLRPRFTGVFLTAGPYFNPGDILAEYEDHYRPRHDPVCVDAPMLGREIKAAFDSCLRGDHNSHLFKAAL
ncbi:hypothetical protein LTR12_007194 [Friedmanniomyces endolithicus]|nr:hypothetical protein LTR74_013968 [Friedmanniomyces endolithicus]KAK1818397.1 hypothetical protein LTR12_007194 [Friedmanniomyces endolithicus]